MLAGCASNPRVAENVAVQPDYSEYVEKVFRYQNGVENQVIQLEVYDIEVDADRARAIYAAEDHMQISCSALNELVMMNSEGRHPGWFLEFRVLLSVAECKVATTQLEDLMNPGGETSLADR
jgi:hypothetical protein